MSVTAHKLCRGLEYSERQSRTRQLGARPTLQDVLVERGDVSPDDMFKEVTLQNFENAKLADLLQGLGYANEDILLRAAAEHSNLRIVDLSIDPPTAACCRLWSRPP